MKFYAGRVSLIYKEVNLFTNSYNGNKFDLVMKALSEKSEFTTKYNINLVISPIFNESNRLVGGKLGKAAETDIPFNNEGELEKVHTKIYPFIHYIIIEEEQLIFFEHDSKNFPEILSVLRYMAEFLNSKIFQTGYEVEFEPLTKKGAFWDVLNDSDFVYEVKFNLITPNFLGKSYKEMSDILKEERKDTNAKSVVYGLENDKGNLTLSKEGRFKYILEWIEEGAGKWKVKRRTTLSSKCETLASDKEAIQYFESDVKTIDVTNKTLEEIAEELDFDDYKIVGDKSV